MTVFQTTEPSDLRYLYENHEEFGAFPTFLIIPGSVAFMMAGSDKIQIPGKVVDPTRVSKSHYTVFVVLNFWAFPINL